MNRHDFLKTVGATAAGLVLANKIPGMTWASDSGPSPRQKPKVYFTRDINPESLKKMYSLVGQPLSGKVALKLHTGEPHGPNIVPPA